MSGIIIPGDRTDKQRARGRCYNPECQVAGKPFEFETEDNVFCCPKCKADRPPIVHLLVLIHFLVRAENGPIVGSGGLRYKLACDGARPYLATHGNKEAATGEYKQVNCPGCLTAGIDAAARQGWAFKGVK